MKKLLLILLVLFGLRSSAQVDWCDSLYYYTLPSPVFSVVGMTTDSLNDFSDTVSWAWTVCNTQLCFGQSGTYASFPLIQYTDTLKVCYNAYIMNAGSTISCLDVCDSLVYNGTEWVLFPINTVGITEVPLRINNNTAYDLLGRELHYIPNGVTYIKNNKLYIKK